ncbi:MAG: transposase zinc-binding domain-containing protein [Candidatus Ozemobacteraceae bacterium]
MPALLLDFRLLFANVVQAMDNHPAVYRPRNPEISDWYRCVEDYFEEFVRVYDERFAAKFGFWQPHIEKVIYRFLDCGDLHNGFARVKCGDCGHEFFVAYSCYPQRETICSSNSAPERRQRECLVSGG